MRTTRKERAAVLDRLTGLEIDRKDGEALRRIAMTLHNWFELECGNEHGAIERDEKTGKPFWRSSLAISTRWPTPDREAGARKRLAKLMTGYPDLIAYVQTDPRGASLYILRRERLEDGAELESVYSSRGTAVY